MVRRLVIGASIALPLIVVVFLNVVLSLYYDQYAVQLANAFVASGVTVLLFVVLLVSCAALVIAVLGWMLWRGPAVWSEGQAAALRWTYLALALTQALALVAIGVLALLVRAISAGLSMVDVIK